MGDDGDQLPGCAACQFIGRICPPDCALAPHFNPGGTCAGLIAGLQGKNLTECARSYHSEDLRRIFVECTVNMAALGTSAGEDGCRLLIEAVLSEAEKELEPPPEPEPEPERALGSASSSSSDPQLPAVPKQAAERLPRGCGGAEFLALLEVLSDAVSTLERNKELDSNNLDSTLASDKDYQDSSLDEDHEKQPSSISMDDDGDQLPGCAACQFIGRICPPDCALAPHLDTGRTFAGLRLDCLGNTVIERAQCYHLQELRRIFVEGNVEIFAQASPGDGDGGHDDDAHAVEHDTDDSEKPSEKVESEPALTRILESTSIKSHYLEKQQPSISMDINKNHHRGSDDGDQIPGCWACQFIGRICPPDCPLAPHFDTGLTHSAAAIARIGSILIGKIVIEFARSFPQESRRIYVKCLVTVAAIGTFTGEEGCRPLVEAVLSEIEKELEPPPEPKPALCSASSSTDPQLPSALDVYRRLLDDVENGRADLSDFLNAFNDALSTLEKP